MSITRRHAAALRRNRVRATTSAMTAAGRITAVSFDRMAPALAQSRAAALGAVGPRAMMDRLTHAAMRPKRAYHWSKQAAIHAVAKTASGEAPNRIAAAMARDRSVPARWRNTAKTLAMTTWRATLTACGTRGAVCIQRLNSACWMKPMGRTGTPKFAPA